MTDLDATPSTPDEPPASLPALPRRVADVFFAPGRLFAALREEPKWLGALLVGAVVSTIAMAVIPAEMWVESMREAMLEQGGTLPEGFDPDAMGGIQKGFAVGGTAVFWFVMAFFFAGVTSLVFTFLLGDRGGYRRHLAVVSHALIITALGSAIVTPLRLLQGDVQLTLNLGLFVPLEDGFLASFLRSQDLFWLWTFVVIGIGAHELDRKRSTGVAVTIALLVPICIGVVTAWFMSR